MIDRGAAKTISHGLYYPVLCRLHQRLGKSEEEKCLEYYYLVKRVRE